MNFFNLFYLVRKEMHQGLSFPIVGPPTLETLPSGQHSLQSPRGATKVRPHFGEEFPLNFFKYFGSFSGEGGQPLSVEMSVGEGLREERCCRWYERNE